MAKVREAVTTLSAGESRQLSEVGYLHLPNVLTPRQLHAVLDAAPDGRLTGLDDERLDCLWSHPRVLEGVRSVLGGDFHLQRFDRRTSKVPDVPGRTCAQKLHTDCPPAPPGVYYECVAIFPLDPFKANNGATRAIPGSHRWTEDQSAQVPRTEAHPDERRLLGKPGDALILNGHVLHAAGENLTGAPRRAIFSFYVRNDAPRWNVLQWPVTDDLLARLTPEARSLLRRP